MQRIEPTENILEIYANMYTEIYQELPTLDDMKDFAVYICDHIKYGIVQTIKCCIYYRRTYRIL